MSKLPWAALVALALGLTVGPVHAADEDDDKPTISTDQIMTSAYNFSCARWQVVGACFWLQCGLSCSVKTSVKVEHCNPDLLVSAYHETGANPWKEIQALVSSLNRGQGGGSHAERAPKGDHTNVRFKNVDVFGNPALLSFTQWLSKTGYVCKSAVTMFEPYFISTTDTLGWRHGIPDMFYPPAYTPYLREISEGGANWGSVYPRSGFLLQGHDYKAAAVAAQRAGDIVTREDQPHVYDTVAADAEDGWWPPDELVEGDETTGDWQLLLPGGNSDEGGGEGGEGKADEGSEDDSEDDASCAVFPPEDDSYDADATSDPYADKVNEYGDYVWTLWRPYQCCKRKGQTFLFSIGGKSP